MAASMTFDRINIRKRSMMLTYIFSNQEWSSCAGSLVTIIMQLCYKSRWEVRHGGCLVHHFGVSLVPAFAMLYQCLTLPELIKYIKDQQRSTADHESDVSMSKDEIAKLKAAQYAVRFGSCSILLSAASTELEFHPPITWLQWLLRLAVEPSLQNINGRNYCRCSWFHARILCLHPNS